MEKFEKNIGVNATITVLKEPHRDYATLCFNSECIKLCKEDVVKLFDTLSYLIKAFEEDEQIVIHEEDNRFSLFLDNEMMLLRLGDNVFWISQQKIKSLYRLAKKAEEISKISSDFSLSEKVEAYGASSPTLPTISVEFEFTPNGKVKVYRAFSFDTKKFMDALAIWMKKYGQDMID